MSKYFTQPPMPQYISKDIPAFMLKNSRYSNMFPVVDTQYLLLLIRWAEREFQDTKAYFLTDKNKTRLLSTIDFTYLISQTEEFEIIVKNMDDETWSNIPKSIQKIIALCYKHYQKNKEQ